MGSSPHASTAALDATDRALLAAAREVSQRAHAPYSGVRVGAALRDDQGRIHLGCNVENVSYGLTQCAERAAVTAAVADGARRFVAIAVHAGTPAAFAPCGACRQVLAEFATDLRVLWQGEDERPRAAGLGELLGSMLRPEDLPRDAAGGAGGGA